MALKGFDKGLPSYFPHSKSPWQNTRILQKQINHGTVFVKYILIISYLKLPTYKMQTWIARQVLDQLSVGGTGQAQPQLWQLWHCLTGMGRKRKERCQCKTEDTTLHDCAQAAAETTGLSQKAGLLPVHSALQSKNGHLGGVAEDDITKIHWKFGQGQWILCISSSASPPKCLIWCVKLPPLWPCQHLKWDTLRPTKGLWPCEWWQARPLYPVSPFINTVWS